MYKITLGLKTDNYHVSPKEIICDKIRTFGKYNERLGIPRLFTKKEEFYNKRSYLIFYERCNLLKTYKQIGKKYKITRERVRQIVFKAERLYNRHYHWMRLN